MKQSTEMIDMNIEIKELQKKDFKKVIEFAVKGMHFDRYTENKWELDIYGRYFLYLELQRASQVLAAYIEDRLVGVLMADMKGEKKKYLSIWRKVYLFLIEKALSVGYKSGTDKYDEANQEMYSRYIKHNLPDGEICFLAVDSTVQGKGIGSCLLKRLEELERGKRIFLYTDSNCTYQFYERKGFKRVEEKEIKLEIHGKEVPLVCYLYDKKL
jgi:ribosomal protein S18 acetylase RimI-like enzyme